MLRTFRLFYIAILALSATGCGDTETPAAGTDVVAQFDGARVDAAVTTGCPAGFAGCLSGERWICDDKGLGFIQVPCDAGLVCDEGACVECSATVPCKAGQVCEAGTCKTPPLQWVTETLPAALTGQAYLASLQAKGGLPPYVWRVTQGALPTGIVLGMDGQLSGVATTKGAYSFQMQVADSKGQTSDKILTLEVKDGGIVITNSSPLKAATEGENYAQQLTAQGGTAPYFWGIVGGKLPAGLSLGSDGSITGAPQGDGDATFTVKAFDNGNPALTATKELTLPVKLAPLQIVGSQELNLLITKIIVLPLIVVVDQVPVPYSTKLEAKGGKKPYAWSEVPIPAGVKNFLPKSGIPKGLTLGKDGTLAGSVTDASLVFELKVPLSQLTLKGFFFAAEVADSQNPAQAKQALFIIPTVPVGGP